MRPLYDIPATKRLILERLAVGQTLAQLEAAPGFPSAPTVRAWARADAAFAAGLAQARAARRGGRVERRWARWAFPRDWADEFVAALRRGEPVGSLVGGGGGQPSRAMLRAWRRAEPGFDAAVTAAVAAWRGSWRKGRWLYDEAVSDRIVRLRATGATMEEIYAEEGLPGKAIVARWRRLVPEFDGGLRIARGAGSGRKTAAGARANRRLDNAALTEAICDHIALGRGSLRSAARCVPGAPCQGTLYAWRRKSAAFARKVAVAEDFRDDMIVDEAAAVLGVVDALAERGRGAPAGVNAQLGALRLRAGQLRGGRRRGSS